MLSKENGINVLSTFNGIGSIWIALDKLGVKVNKRYSSEIDKYANIINNIHYPDTIQLGDIKKLNTNELEPIDLIVGGSPCTGFSMEGKMLNFSDPKSKLFFEFVRLLDECRKINPNVYFLLENVKMKKEFRDTITLYLNVEPIELNSNLVSAQNRPRYYWTNIPENKLPLVNKNIYLKDVIEKDVIKYDKSYCIDYEKYKGTAVEECINNKISVVSFTERRTELAKKLRKEHRNKYGVDFTPRRAKELVARTDGKMNCITATFSNKEHTIIDENLCYRKTTPLEWERFQNVPDNFTIHVPKNQRYKLLGNGWTIDIIIYILKVLFN